MINRGRGDTRTCGCQYCQLQAAAWHRRGRGPREVDDAGPGVPDELRREVFERFYRDSTARSGADGAGLGLALVARHVRRHDGRVWVQDRPGGGARFVVTLPVEEQDPR